MHAPGVLFDSDPTGRTRLRDHANGPLALLILAPSPGQPVGVTLALGGGAALLVLVAGSCALGVLEAAAALLLFFVSLVFSCSHLLLRAHVPSMRGVCYVLLLLLVLTIRDRAAGTPVCEEDLVDAGAGALEGGLFVLEEEGAFLVELVGGFEVQWIDQVGIYSPGRQKRIRLGLLAYINHGHIHR